ncbi:metallophosphoesterase [Clostridiisalibacter paucivorans]|uniref:metallophosphoesterase n=1 Tax=Clostridiisalibacter paucivorans TaxID=408753 RepID=UPI000478ADAE|nr:metallophosphoesterase [Clostridiisalibacter paucivorans]
MKKRKRKTIIYLLAIILLIVFLYYENNGVTVSHYDIKSERIPQSFVGFKILQISDLHNKVFLNKNKGILKKIRDESPDVIVITGDLIDRRKYNEDNAMMLINSIKDMAPIYYVTGNHEGWSGKFYSLERKLKENDVTILRNESINIERDNDSIQMIGIDDPAFNTKGYMESYKNIDILNSNMNNIKNRDLYTILLSHRPEMFDLYADKEIDLVFSGHAHGGQIRIPLIGGLIAPDQGLFPKYYQGIYIKGNTSMIVSRGLGNSIVPQRLFNRPEIVVVTFKE